MLTRLQILVLVTLSNHEYTLHPTFPNPARVVCDRPSRFELAAQGWGTFTVGVKLMLKDCSVRQLTSPLEFR